MYYEVDNIDSYGVDAMSPAPSGLYTASYTRLYRNTPGASVGEYLWYSEVRC